jgi:hypothetical protein
MKFRPQRGSLRESMSEVVEIEPTYLALATLLNTNPEAVEVAAYGFDPRINWHTWVVTVNGQGVGFTDQGVYEPIPQADGDSGSLAHLPEGSY